MGRTNLLDDLLLGQHSVPKPCPPEELKYNVSNLSAVTSS